jgi:hypothetical protein
MLASRPALPRRRVCPTPPPCLDARHVLIVTPFRDRHAPTANARPAPTVRPQPAAPPFRKPSARALLAFSLCATLLLLLGALQMPRTPALSPPTAALPRVDPHVVRGQLLCALEPADGGAAAFRLVVTNLHPSSAVSLLLRGSPFDDAAVGRGGAFDVRGSGPLGAWVVEVDPMADGVADLHAGDDFVEILPFHAMTKDVDLRSSVVGLQRGMNYTVQARGRWRAVWHAKLEDYDSGYLKRLGGATGLIDWSYTSNALEVAVT